MALQITVTRDGETANYWRLMRAYFNSDEKDFITELRGYVNLAQSNDERLNGNKRAKFKLRFSFTGADFPDVTGAGWIAGIYTKIKGTTRYGVDWSTAIDV